MKPKTETDNPDLLTTSEAADYLRLSKITLEKWRRVVGQGPQFVRLGGKVFYRRVRLDEFITAQESNQ